MRALHYALTAGASALLAAIGFVAASWLDVFAPCRVVYRLAVEVRGSVACQTYYATMLFCAVLMCAACGQTAIAGILFLVRRRTRS